LPKRSNGPASSLKMTADGRVFVPADVVLLLGVKWPDPDLWHDQHFLDINDER
jgi:hypothetical protein